MNRLDTDKQFSDTFNKLCSDPNPSDRCQLALRLSDGLGALLMLPTPVLDQFIAQLDSDQKRFTTGEPENPIVKALVDLCKDATLARSNKTIATLKAFRKVRPQLKEELDSLFQPDTADSIPD